MKLNPLIVGAVVIGFSGLGTIAFQAYQVTKYKNLYYILNSKVEAMQDAANIAEILQRKNTKITEQYHELSKDIPHVEGIKTPLPDGVSEFLERMQ